MCDASPPKASPAPEATDAANTVRVAARETSAARVVGKVVFYPKPA